MRVSPANCLSTMYPVCRVDMCNNLHHGLYVPSTKPNGLGFSWINDGCLFIYLWEVGQLNRMFRQIILTSCGKDSIHTLTHRFNLCITIICCVWYELPSHYSSPCMCIVCIFVGWFIVHIQIQLILKGEGDRALSLSEINNQNHNKDWL